MGDRIKTESVIGMGQNMHITLQAAVYWETAQIIAIWGARQ